MGINTVLIVHPNKLAAGKEFGLCNSFKVYKGTCYLGGFIGDDKSKRNLLKYWTIMWEKTFMRSPKRRVNIPRRVTPQWFMQSNYNGSFGNV